MSKSKPVPPPPQKPKKKTPLRYYLTRFGIALLVAFISAGAYVVLEDSFINSSFYSYFYSSSSSSFSPPSYLNLQKLGLTPEFGLHDNVAKMVVDHVSYVIAQDDNFAQEIAKNGVPVIIRNASILNWRAYTLWHIDPEGYLASKVPELTGIQTHYNSTFRYFHGSRPLSSVPSIQAGSYSQKTYARVNLTSKEFFQKIRDKTENDPFLYYADKVHSLGDDVANDLYPIDFLVVKDKDFDPNVPHKHRVTHVWIGPRGATTHAHYDVYQNFYVQLKGRKRFYLIPPEAFHYLYLYPFLHPGGQQTQIDFESPNFDEFPLFSRIPKAISPVVATLEPGDILYLPPLWFHHVSALTPSISISVWSPDPFTKKVQQLTEERLPFRGKWPKEKLAAAGAIYITQLVENSAKATTQVFDQIGKSDAKTFVLEVVLNQRYRPLYKHVPALVRNPKSDEPSYCGLLSQIEFTEAETEDIFTVAKTQAKVFEGVGWEQSALWIGNMVEQIALTVIGKPYLVATYLEDFVKCM